MTHYGAYIDIFLYPHFYPTFTHTNNNNSLRNTILFLFSCSIYHIIYFYEYTTTTLQKERKNIKGLCYKQGMRLRHTLTSPHLEPSKVAAAGYDCNLPTNH